MRTQNDIEGQSGDSHLVVGGYDEGRVVERYLSWVASVFEYQYTGTVVERAILGTDLHETRD